MVCKGCGRKLREGEECIFCGSSVQDEIYDPYEAEPVVEVSKCGNTIKALAIVYLVLGCLGGFLLGLSIGLAYTIAIILTVLLTGMLCYGIGEICCLLKSIDSKL